jgi:hypothetical protein
LPPRPSGADPQRSQWYLQASDDAVHVSTLYDLPLAGRPGLSISRRMPSGAVFSLNLTLDALATFLARYRPSPGSVLFVFNDYGIKNYTMQHANEAFKVAPELAKNGVHTSIFADWWAYKFEVYYSTAYNAAILNKYGVINSINSDSDELIRHLNHEAAKAVRYGGVPELDALKMITINPAIQLGIANRVGSIEVGKEADFALWSKHPLSIYSIAERTWVDGVKRFDIETDRTDMRLRVNPAANFESSMISESGRHADSCMEGVLDFFTFEAMEHSHE